jgi:hypothetical protein
MRWTRKQDLGLISSEALLSGSDHAARRRRGDAGRGDAPPLSELRDPPRVSSGVRRLAALARRTERQAKRMNVDTLSGRDLDAMVAQHVFGLLVERRIDSRTGERDFLYAVHPGRFVRVPFYSASLGESINVEVEIKKRGWKRIVIASVDPDAPNDLHVVFHHIDGRQVSAAGLLNEALCRAALKAVAL